MVRRVLAVLPAVLLGLGCASPTLPLPPPDDPTVTPGADADHVKLVVPCGGAEPGAVIVVVNNNSNVPPDQAVTGALVSNCGGWDDVAYAHHGDFLTVTQQIGTEASQPAVVQVP